MDDDDILQFTSITSSTPERARQYLTLSDGNVEQAIQLFFESGGVDMGGTFEAPSTSTQAPSTVEGSAAANAIRVDSDDESTGGVPIGGQTHGAEDDEALARKLQEDDEAMARRMQEELYGEARSSGAGEMDIDPETGVRRPVARQAETLSGPNATSFMDDDAELNAAVREQLRRRRQVLTRPGIFNQAAPPSHAVWEDEAADRESRRRDLARATGGASETSSKSNKLAEMYRPPFEIMSPLTSWDGIRAQGKEEEKWILLNVQDSNIFDCQVLNRDIWKHPEIKETVRENFIFKQYTKNDPQAQNYIRFYFHDVDNEDAYPHIAIVDPRTGEQVKVWSGPPAPKPIDFLTQLHEFLDRYSLKANSRNPVAKRRSEAKGKAVEKMTEEEMLELAMANSLANGKSTSVAEDPDVLTRSIELPPKRNGESQTASTAETQTDQDVPMVDSPFAQISSSHPHEEPAANAPNVTRIQFRHPGGRIIRRFSVEDRVIRIYEWLKSSPIEGKEGQQFELVFMGKNLLDLVDQTIQDAGLKNGSIMVEFLEE